MFFEGSRENFFRPLVGKRREIMVACLKAFYEYLYTSSASSTYHVTKADLKNIFSQIIREMPTLQTDDMDNSDEERIDSNDEMAYANYVIRKLEEFGWLEEYMDKGTMISAYRFSRAGKAFTQTFLDLENRFFETKQRNVRNTRSALLAFSTKQDPYDLLDAARYAQRVNEDIADDIADLHERKRLLFQQTNNQRSVLEDFLLYIEREFIPNISLRFSADSVERYRYDIMDIAEKIRQWPLEQQTRANSRVRPLLPANNDQLINNDVIENLLNNIERSLDAACTNTLPELRFALSSFTHRLDLIVRQATAMLTGIGSETIGQAIKALANLSAEEQQRQLTKIGHSMGSFTTFLIDPANLKLRTRTVKPPLATNIEMREPTREELREAALAQAEEQAFAVTMTEIKTALTQQMQPDGTLRLSDWIVHDAPSLIALCHAIEAASVSALDEGAQFKLITPKEKQQPINNPLLTYDDFILQQVSDE